MINTCLLYVATQQLWVLVTLRNTMLPGEDYISRDWAN